MEHRHDLHKHNNILKILSKLPRKIVSVHGSPNVHELVLYDFCNEACFNFGKIAYFVDNPDFNCFRGVAGVAREECTACSGIADIWQEQEKFHTIMQGSAFNNKIRSIEKSTLAGNPSMEQEIIKQLATELAFAHPDYYKWKSKHDNNGYLLYDRSCDHTGQLHEHLMDGAYLLSFCPIA